MTYQIPKNIKSIISLQLILSIISFNFAVIPQTTIAYVFDNEMSSGNIFKSGILDTRLGSTNFMGTSGDTLSKDNPLFAIIDVLSSSSIQAKYRLTTSPVEDDEYNLAFCDNLNLSIKNTASSALSFSSVINKLSSDYINLSPSQSFNAKTETINNNDFPGAKCTFDLNLFAKQVASGSESGFFDNESQRFTLKSLQEETRASVSPIKDSTIDHDHPNNNYGNDNVIRVKAESGKEKRSLVAFKYKLPSTLNIKYSQLVLTIKEAPSSSRIYKINRITDTWMESNVAWNNQPAIDMANPVLANTGIAKKVKIAWDVTSNVQERISADQEHYGWMISDTNEQTSKSIQTEFHSKEASDYNEKPKLTLVFDVPQVDTDHLVINEVYYDVEPTKGNDPNNEWIEIYNPTANEISIDGWYICDSQGCDTIPSNNYKIPAKGFAVIANNASTWQTYWQLPEKAIRIALGTSIGQNGLGNAGDLVRLKSPDNSVVDQMSYGSDTSVFNPSIPLFRNGDSTARIIKGFDNNIAADFIQNIKPNPGTNPSETNETSETITIFEDGFMMQAGEQDIVPVLDQETLQNISDSNIILNNATQSDTQTTSISQTEGSALNIASESLSIESTASTSTTIETQDESDTTPTDPDLQSVTPTENSNDTSIMSNSEAIIEEGTQETNNSTENSDNNSDSDNQDAAQTSDIPQNQDMTSTNNTDS